MRLKDDACGYAEHINDYDASEVIGRRIAAGLLDLFVIVLLMVPVGLAFGGGYSSRGHAGVQLRGASAIVWIVLALAYYCLLEAAFGRTLGKYALRLRVLTVNGVKPPLGAIMLRTLFRAVDFLPGFYILGLVVMIASRRRAARIGDFAARTSVVASPARSGARRQPEPA